MRYYLIIIVLGIALSMLVLVAGANQSRAVPQDQILNDRVFLTNLYNETNGPQWTRSDNWLSDQPLDTWYGVKTDPDNPTRVTGLELRENNLQGELPYELTQMGWVETINLEGNKLTGRIHQIAGWHRLSTLNVSRNQLQGEIPGAELARLKTLRVLQLGANEFTGPIPTDVTYLPNLEVLDLGGNHLSGPIPPELGQLRELRFLALSDNRLAGPFPPELTDLLHLEWINLSNNELSGSIPRQISNLGNLKGLALVNTGIGGVIPKEIGFLQHLEGIELSHNRLVGPFPDLQHLRQLNRVFVRNNYLMGELTADQLSLQSLEKIEIADNSFSGCIPVDFKTIRENDFDLTGLQFCSE